MIDTEYADSRSDMNELANCGPVSGGKQSER